MNLSDLRMVRAVAETGTLREASTRLHVTTSALSHRLRKLERGLGAPLFKRQGRRMLPNGAGWRLSEAAGEILHRVREAEDEARRVAREEAPAVRVATECYTCYHWLPSLLKTLRNAGRRFDVQVVLDAKNQLRRALLEQRVDLGIVSSEVRDGRLRLLPLFRDELLAVVATEHPLAQRDRLNPGDLADEHLVLHTPLREAAVYGAFLQPSGVMPRQVSTVPLTEAILELVKARLGIGVLARWAVAPSAARGEIATVPLGASGLQRQWSAAVRARGAGAALEVAEHLATKCASGLLALSDPGYVLRRDGGDETGGVANAPAGQRRPNGP